MRPSSYNIIVSLPETNEALLFHGYSGAVDLVQSHVADLLHPRARHGSRTSGAASAATRRELEQRGYLTDKTPSEEEAYVTELGTRVHRVMHKHSSPGVLVVPTYSCNLRCTYCYEQALQTRGKSWINTVMSPEMAEAALEAGHRINKSTRPPRALTLYGGEPFQKQNRHIVRFIHGKALERGFQRFTAITNAVDLNDYEELLGPGNKFSFLQITLDGPPEVHDQRRFLPDRSGTFQKIAKNISLALNRSVQVSVRVNVDRSNAEVIKSLQSFFREKGWTGNKLFRAYCSPVHGGVCGQQSKQHFSSHLEMQQALSPGLGDNRLGEEDPSFQVAAFTQAIRKRILAHLTHKESLPHWRTAFCGSNMAMLLLDPFGDIYPCWEVIGHPEHRIGVYGPGFADLDDKGVKQWHHRSVVQIPACRSCAYLFFCGGGCEAFAYHATGRLDQPHCFDFPSHFSLAARLAYRDWTNLREKNTDPTAVQDFALNSASGSA